MRLSDINESFLAHKVREAIAHDRPFPVANRNIEPTTGHDNYSYPLSGTLNRRRGRRLKSLELRPGTIRL